MRALVKAGALSVAVAGLLLVGGCATMGAAVKNDPARETYIQKVSGQMSRMQARISAIQARLENLSGQTRTHLADKLAAVRLDLFSAQRDLRTLRAAGNAGQWKTDRGHLTTAIHSMDKSVSALDQAVQKA